MTDAPKIEVREEAYHVRVNLPEGPMLTTVTGSRRKVFGLRLSYARTPSVDRVDVVVEFRNEAQTMPPTMLRPQWLDHAIDLFYPKYHLDKEES